MQLLSPFMMHRPTPSCQREPEYSPFHVRRNFPRGAGRIIPVPRGALSFYGGTGWYKAKLDYSADDVYKEEGYQAYLGLTHCF